MKDGEMQAGSGDPRQRLRCGCALKKNQTCPCHECRMTRFHGKSLYSFAQGFATLPVGRRLPPSGCLLCCHAMQQTVRQGKAKADSCAFSHNERMVQHALSSYQGMPEPTPLAGGALTPYGLLPPAYTIGAGPCPNEDACAKSHPDTLSNRGTQLKCIIARSLGPWTGGTRQNKHRGRDSK